MYQKSYNGLPSVYVIPTPIGNMDDITLRAIEILKFVDIIFCEDTRVTNQLLNKFDIKKSTISSHKFNESKNKEKLIKFLENKQNVGIVSDRGTPGISDPGSILISHAIENNYNVISLPGPTALIPALVSSGIDTTHFLFYGFLDSKSSKRKTELKSLLENKYTLIFYEAPHRIKETLFDILEVLGNRKISISREISKKFEEIIRGNIKEIVDELDVLKGEIVIVVEGNLHRDEIEIDIMEKIKKLLDQGFTTKEAIKSVSEIYNINKNIVYSTYLRGQK